MKQIITGQDESVCRWVCKQTDGEYAHGMVGIGLVEYGPDKPPSLIAGVVYDGYNGANINMHVAAIGGAGWLTREFLWFAFAYPFLDLGVRRVTGLVPSSNRAARRFDEHLGFREEARLIGAHRDGDLIVYRMFRDECRWLTHPSTRSMPNVRRQIVQA